VSILRIAWKSSLNFLDKTEIFFVFHRWLMRLIQVFQSLIKVNCSAKQCQILEVSVLLLQSQRIVSTAVWSEGTTWLSAEFAHVLRSRLSNTFKTQKLHHVMKKSVTYKTTLPTDLLMCSHRIKRIYIFIRTNLVLKSVFGLEI
jgi:hypothetical protein